MIVRDFRAADAAPLTSMLHAAYAELGAMGLNFTAVDQSERVTVARARAGRCWVVEQDGALVGTVAATYPPADGIRRISATAREPGTAWLSQLAVHPGTRGTGIGRLLWRTVREWAGAQGATAVALDTAVPAAHLQRLYAGWGFAPRETISWPGKRYDSLVMRCPLGGLGD